MIIVIMILITAGGSMQDTRDAVTAEIIALEKGALTRWIAGDPWGFVDIASEQITYFDPFTAKRVDGKAAFAAFMEPLKGKIHADRFEMINPLVVVRGDLAALSFNFSAKETVDGVITESLWNSSEVYVRENGIWRLVHSHWSPTQPKFAK